MSDFKLLNDADEQSQVKTNAQVQVLMIFIACAIISYLHGGPMGTAVCFLALALRPRRNT